jgi:hypothetical protein
MSELMKQELPAQLEVQTPNAMQLIQVAISQGASIDTIERLAKLQREMVDYGAMVDFNEAMHRAQQKMRPISADATNPQTKSKYASYSKLDKALRPIYSAEGFALSFNTADSPLPDHIRVTCEVTRGGYSKPYQIDMPADGKGAKGGDVMTKTHATGSATSYGMRYLLKMIFNVAVGEDDNDGNGAGREMDLEEFDRIKVLIETAPNIAVLKDTYMSALKAANKAGDVSATRSFAAAKDARKHELERVAQ